MESYSIGRKEELKSILSTFEHGSLFRGQVKNFGTETMPTMNTSFARNGCVPPLMLRWDHYSASILSALLGLKDHTELSIEWSQALLQHYGWRSFYLDASSDAAVSAWFASHSYSEKRSIEMCEDCFEDPVWLVKNMASYAFEEGYGYLYVLSKDAIIQTNLSLFDLSEITLPDCSPRFQVQSAWLVGPLHGNLPFDCIKAIIRSPRSVLRDFAEESGFMHTSNLFPDHNKDPVLEFFNSLPWEKISLPDDSGLKIDAYRQPIEFPEYHDNFRKIHPEYTAFYNGDIALDTEELVDDPFPGGVVIFGIPEQLIFGSNKNNLERFPYLQNILQDGPRHFIFEIDNLVRKPVALSSEYLKGVAISKCENGLYSVADFSVDHPGKQMTGCGIGMGWHYKIARDGRWLREASSDDCTCGNILSHQRHLSILSNIEKCLSENPSEIVRRSNRHV